MGSGIWSTDVYAAAKVYRKASGKTDFDYSDSTTRSTPRSSWKTHKDLDPFGVALRESRDSDEHPNSVAIAVLLDVTGSMGRVPRVLQQKLPDLFGLLLKKGYVKDPQILFGAIGDATCDRAPLQMGQFESDNRLDEQLGNILLEGGGGGQMSESYELAMYFMARHTSIDCMEKRGRKGYLFLIGDELAYPKVSRSQVKKLIGDTLGEDLDTAALVAELRRSYEVFYLLPEGASYSGNTEILEFWRGLLGQNVLILDDLDAVCETIAVTIGLNEGVLDDLDAGLKDLQELGLATTSVAKALAKRSTATIVAVDHELGVVDHDLDASVLV